MSDKDKGKSLDNDLLGFGIALFPLSWKLDFWEREKKDILAIGPLRLVLYKHPGEWKDDGDANSA